MCKRNLCLSIFLTLVWGWDAAAQSPQGFIMELIISFACVVPLCLCSWLSCARFECRPAFSLPCSAYKFCTVLEARNKQYRLSYIHLYHISPLIDRVCLTQFPSLFIFQNNACVWIWQGEGEWMWERERANRKLESIKPSTLCVHCGYCWHIHVYIQAPNLRLSKPTPFFEP